MGTPAARPEVLEGRTLRYCTGCGNLYVIVNNWPEGEGTGAREVFARLGKPGACAATMCEAVARMISTALQHGASSEEIATDLIGQACNQPTISDGVEIQSCIDAIGRAMRECSKEADNAGDS